MKFNQLTKEKIHENHEIQIKILIKILRKEKFTFQIFKIINFFDIVLCNNLEIIELYLRNSTVMASNIQNLI